VKYLALILIGVLLGIPYATGAEPLQVSTSKQTYHYGDYLSVIIEVSDTTAGNAVMYIIDSGGVKSSAIQIKISQKTTTLTAPNSFDPMLFKEGKYKIEIDYNGAKSFAEFELVDIGNVVMPFGSTAVVSQWSDGKISDYIFLKFLADKNLVSLPAGQSLGENAKIPSWYKTNAKWWSEKEITDEEFVKGIQYLLSKKIITV
jgi:hypothetical protein